MDTLGLRLLELGSELADRGKGGKVQGLVLNGGTVGAEGLKVLDALGTALGVAAAKDEVDVGLGNNQLGALEANTDVATSHNEYFLCGGHDFFDVGGVDEGGGEGKGEGEGETEDGRMEGWRVFAGCGR